MNALRPLVLIAFIVPMIQTVTLSQGSDLLVRVGPHATAIQSTLRTLIGQEHYTQSYRTGESRRGSLEARRTIESEFMFWSPPEAPGWVYVRKVGIVDGRPVPTSDARLDRLFTSSASDQSRLVVALKNESARYDIGRVWRTTGNPTLALRFFLPENQSRFAIQNAGQERVAGRMVRRLHFREESIPTIVHVNDADVLASGTLWADDDGTIVRTELTITGPAQIKATIRVDFSPARSETLWLPRTMNEHYEDSDGGVTDCLATYSSYRKFVTSGRVLVP